MKHLRSTLSIAAVVIIIGGTAGGCRPGRSVDKPMLFDPQAIDGERALREVEQFIDLGPRISGTPGAERAADYLRDKLAALDITVEIDEFNDPAPGGPLTFRNVLGIIPGTGEDWVVIGSHYDTKSGISPDFIGANDSGSSTGLLLELARVLNRRQPPVNILLAFLDGEECREAYGKNDGLHGSRRLARAFLNDGRAKTTRAVIIIDMIGDRDLSLTLPRNVTPALGAAVLKAAELEGARQRCRLTQFPILDDHQPFLDAGIPAVLLIDFEFGSTPGANDYWHTPADSFDKLSAESLQTIGRMVIHILNRIMP